MMSMIGEFRERVSVQQESRTPDTGGGAVLSWTEVAIVWASVQPQRGKENVQSEDVTGVGAYRVYLRADVDVTAAMRLVWRSRVLNIRSVRVMEARGRLMEIIAEESVAT